VVVDRRQLSAGYGDRVDLRLPFPPTVEHMADHADHIAAVVRRIDGADLDYSVESLEVVDRVLGQFHDAGDQADQMAETLFQFGAYVGEVIVRQADGQWATLPDDHPLASGWPLVALPSGVIVNPIAKAFKRVANGDVDSIGYFYRALVVG
jgi:Family of unknown function (DUF6278)